MNCFAFHKQHDPRHLQNVQSVAALELAGGCHLPDDFGGWPLGLADNWDAAAEQEAFDTCRTLGDMARAFLKWRAAELDRQIGAGTVSAVAEDSPTSSRRSIHFFNTEDEAISYRANQGTGGWIFVCDDKGEATIFPYQTTPGDILKTGWTSSSGGRFIGSTGKIARQEDVA